MFRRSTAALAAMAVLTAAAVGCGGDEAATTDGPATLVPAEGTVLYAEAQIKPDDERAEGVRSALRKVARRDDVLQLLQGEFDSAIGERSELTYERDIEPWLGERAGLFFLNFSDEPDGAVILEAEDEGGAREALEKAKPGFEGDSAGEVIDGHLVIGSRAGVDAVRRAAEGDALADAESYTAALDPLDDERLGHLWVDVRKAIESAPADAGAEVETYRRRLADVDQPYATAAIDVDEQEIAVEIAGASELGQALQGLDADAETTASELLGDLPADAWLALGVRGGGQTFAQGFTEGLRGAGPMGATAIEEIERRAGVDLEADLLGQMRDLAFHVSGTGLTSIGVGLLIGADDPARVLTSTRRLIETFGAGQVAVEASGDEGFVVRLQGAPFSLQVKQTDELVAAALGGDAADRLLDPAEPLRESDVLDEIADDLGDDANVAGFLKFAPMIELVDGLAANDPDWQQARPYLEAYERLSFGDRKEGDWLVNRIVVRLK